MDEDKFYRFEDWLLSNGCSFPKLALKDYGNGVRGCHATEDVAVEECIITIPLKCLITVEMGKDMPIGRLIETCTLELDAPKHIFLMVFMLIDRKKPNSFFKPYYDILPKTLENMPIFWAPYELKYLEGSYLLVQIEERKEAIESDYNALCSLDPTFGAVCDLHDFMWARMCVCSRNFGLIVNGLRTAALVPYADMLNHYRPRETKWQFEDNKQSFTVIATESISRAAQVYDSYGQKCNHRFLLNYGFSVENNIEPDGFCPNEVSMLVSLDKDDPAFEKKMTFWRRESAVPSRRIRVAVGDNENSRILLSLLRVTESDPEEFDLLISSSGSKPSGSSGYRSIRNAHYPVSARLEVKALTSLRILCDDLLSAYPTSYEDDCRRLALTGDRAVPQFSNERNALIQVKGEKEVLRFYQEFAETGIRLLGIREYDDAEFTSELQRVQEEKHFFIHQYCRDVCARIRYEDRKKQETRLRSIDFSKPAIV